MEEFVRPDVANPTTIGASANRSRIEGTLSLDKQLHQFNLTLSRLSGRSRTSHCYTLLSMANRRSAAENDATEAAHRDGEIDNADDEHRDKLPPDEGDVGAAEQHRL